MRTLICSLIVASTLALSVPSAQDAAAPKVVFKLSGESVYDFAAEITIVPTPDLTKAGSVVEAWCLLTDKRGGYDTPRPEPDIRHEALENKAMDELEAAILDEQLAKDQKDARALRAKAVSGYQSSREATTITETAEQEDGSVLITTLQKGQNRFLNKENKYEVSPMEQGIRYRAVKGIDGLWRIDGMELHAEGRGSTKEKPIFSWTPYRNFILEFALELGVQPALARPEFKTATAEGAALSFANDMRNFEHAAELYYIGSMCNALLEVADWFTNEYKDITRKAVEERAARGGGKEAPLAEVEEVKDQTESAATVVFKFIDSNAKDKLVIKVVKVGEAWRVSEVGDLRKAGTDKETYEPKKDIYRRW
jgi:hypothetical protein